MLDFLFSRLLYTDLLILNLIFAIRMPKRENFLPRAIITSLLGLAVSYLWHSLLSLSGWGQLVAIIDNLSSLIFAILVVYTYTKMNTWGLLYLGITAWFCQYIVTAFETIFSVSGGMTWSGFIRHIFFLVAVGFVVYFIFFRKINYQVLKNINFHSIYLIWIIMCTVCLALNTYSAMVGEQNTSFYLAELLCCVVGLLYQNSLYRFCGYELEEQRMNLLLKESQKQYEKARESMEQINIKSHDLRHMIEGFRIEGKVNESELKEMEQVVNGYDDTVHTENPVLDVLLTEKSYSCRKRNIGFTCYAEGAGINYIPAGDLYALFGNAIENAIEATEKIDDPEKKQISLTMHREKDMYLVYLQNFSAVRLKLVDGLPQTTKESDQSDHGYGVKSMIHLAEKYDGKLTIRQDGDMVELFMLLPAA